MERFHPPPAGKIRFAHERSEKIRKYPIANSRCQTRMRGTAQASSAAGSSEIRNRKKGFAAPRFRRSADRESHQRDRRTKKEIAIARPDTRKFQRRAISRR